MICRLCLTETEFCLPLKNAKNQDKDEETEDIADIIRKHFDLPLDINSDLVCSVCWQQIREFHTFYLFIEEKQKELSQQTPILSFIGTRNDATDDEHAKDGNVMNVKNECLISINTPMVTENSLSQWGQEATENLEGIKKELIEENIGASNCEPSATPTETDSEYETEISDEDDVEVDMKNYSLIEISSPMITENSLCQWKKKITENLGDIKNVQLIDQVNIKSENCDTNTSDIAETTSTQQCKITSTEEKKSWKNRTLRRKMSDLIIAKHAGILKCELCTQTVETFCNLRQHFKKKHGRKGYVRCCNKRFYLHYTYAEHLEWHSYANFWKCEPCNLAFSCRGFYINHLLRVHPEGESSKFQCIVCPEKFSHGYFLRQHIKSQHSEQNVKCDECNKEFTTYKLLSTHKKTIHQRVYRTECDICGMSFVNRTNCRKHKEKVHNVEEKVKFQCPNCPQRFAFERQLYAHRKESHNEQKFKCDECDKELKSCENLKTHKRRVHLRTDDVKCEICGKTVQNPAQLRIHKARVHEVEEFLNFQCPLCPMKFALKCLLKEHTEDVHSKQNSKCDECDKEFKSLISLNKHKRNYHLRSGDHECDICGKILANRTKYKIHKARVHGAEEFLTFQCPICPKKFALKSLLNVHKKENHSKEKFKCDECDKELKNVGSLRQHKRQFHKMFANSTRSCIKKADINQLT